MYDEKDLGSLREQFRRRLMALLVPAALLLIPLVWSLIERKQWLTVLMTALLGSLCIFYWDLRLSPISAYRRHLQALLAGRKRDTRGRFMGFEEATTLRDKVLFRAFLLNVGDPAEGKDDRVLYWDANLPLPDWQVGELIEVSSFDKAVSDWKRL